MKFTHEKPTVPGAYWWKHSVNRSPILVEISDNGFGELWMNTTAGGEGRVFRSVGEWSERLVPVGEVQIAFVEGACAVRHWSHLKPHELWDSGVKIRARRVVEGKDEV